VAVGDAAGGAAIDAPEDGALAGAGAGAVPAGAGAGAAAAGAASGALCTGRNGAAEGGRAGALGAAGPVAAGNDALTAPVEAPPPGDAPAAAGSVTPAGGGGGAVPMPNKLGDAAGDDGSGNGVVAARYCAFARSATRPWVIVSSALRSGASGLGGTVARFGYGAVEPGGGGRCCAIAPPCASCHQLTGFIDDVDEQPASSNGGTRQNTVVTAA